VEQNAFWEGYFGREQDNYEQILSQPEKVWEGTVAELAQTFSMDTVEFAGFLDGINTSLKVALDLDSLEEDSAIRLDVDLEKLYYNMLDAKANWLYNLPQWDTILTAERRKEITKEYRSSKMYVNTVHVGRNDPCPCGSGKKYKNCCGKNA